MFIAAGVLGGAVNAVAGGAKLFVFPMLLAAGLPPVVANATGTVGVWPGGMPAAWVYRDRLHSHPLALLREMLPALAGSLTGAGALILSGDRLFTALVPGFLVLAVATIAFGEQGARLAQRAAGSGSGVLAALLLFACGFYGGFFGAGLGYLLMAALTVAGVVDTHDAIARKNLFAMAINSVAVVPLGLSGLVSWPAAGLVAVGGLLGGWLGARLARLLPTRPLRWLVALAGAGLTLAFLLR